MTADRATNIPATKPYAGSIHPFSLASIFLTVSQPPKLARMQKAITMITDGQLKSFFSSIPITSLSSVNGQILHEKAGKFQRGGSMPLISLKIKGAIYVVSFIFIISS